MKSVLIVDDSRTSRRILRDILERAGYNIIGEAVDGREGYDEYVKLDPDIVTMDITMPVVDGLECLKLIKKSDPNAKVVMITAAARTAVTLLNITEVPSVVPAVVAARTPRVPNIAHERYEVNAPNSRFSAMAAINLFAPPRSTTAEKPSVIITAARQASTAPAKAEPVATVNV